MAITFDFDTDELVETDEDGVEVARVPVSDDVALQIKDPDAWAAAQAARVAEQNAPEVLRQTMFDLTEDIIAWCQDTQAFLYSNGVHGKLDVNPGYLTLLSRAEAALLASKALANRTEAVADQERWMLQRGQQAQSLLGLAAVLK